MTSAIVVATLLMGAAASGNHPGLERAASEADLLRAFGFASCLAKGYAGKPAGEDAERVADLYRQMGRVPIEAYDEIRRAADEQQPARPALSDGQNYAIMACLEFYEGPALKRLAARAARRK